jgi:hypothetical protein
MIDREAEQRVEAQHLLQQLRAGAIDDQHVANALHSFGDARLLEARADVERYLTHPDPNIRHMALHVLTLHFDLQDHWQTAVDFLLHDPVHTRRVDGAEALGWLKRDTQDRGTLEILAQVVRNKAEEEEVRSAAYAAMREILHEDREEQMRLLDLDWDLERDADWAFVDSFLS